MESWGLAKEDQEATGHGDEQQVAPVSGQDAEPLGPGNYGKAEIQRSGGT